MARWRCWGPLLGQHREQRPPRRRQAEDGGAQAGAERALGPKVFDSRWAAHKEAALSEVLADGIVSLVDEDVKVDVEKRMAARPPWK
ncbi:hypothetical protein HUA74_30720 [Myxococcus sp. CA051A]|uniref:hypothetical protein n=1 Tax=Myxococcus sp. CA051A TaxID=2741739 RepID=UPI00157A298E|nr:hypothetical protein [Myxococcus sp. CA051A]NTX65037.1 hypothetical protein [Myxococcus sp. CA051A]